jgi:putative transposase
MRPTREQARSSVGVYFVSTQTAGRKPFFRHERWARLMMTTMDHYGARDFRLHAYVVMPDHLHLLIEPFNTIEKAAQLVKGGFSFRARRELGWNGEIWQPGFTEHRIRDDKDWQHHLEYIRSNPQRARLVLDPALYPYMNFFTCDFPQGLKPSSAGTENVRAKARTLPREGTAEAVPFQNSGNDVSTPMGGRD